MPFTKYNGLLIGFFTDEGKNKALEPVHIHVKRGRTKLAKIWITKDGFEVSGKCSLSKSELKDVGEFINKNRDLIILDWKETFKSVKYYK